MALFSSLSLNLRDRYFYSIQSALRDFASGNGTMHIVLRLLPDGKVLGENIENPQFGYIKPPEEIANDEDTTALIQSTDSATMFSCSNIAT